MVRRKNARATILKFYNVPKWADDKWSNLFTIYFWHDTAMNTTFFENNINRSRHVRSPTRSLRYSSLHWNLSIFENGPWCIIDRTIISQTSYFRCKLRKEHQNEVYLVRNATRIFIPRASFLRRRYCRHHFL